MFHQTQYVPHSFCPSAGITQLLTTQLTQTLFSVNPNLNLPNFNHALTVPSSPAHNNGLDNESYDYIVYSDSIIGSSTSNEGNSCALKKNSSYRVISTLGSGSFGQVLKCEDTTTNKIVALKILKNKPHFFRQGMLEIAMLSTVNNVYDKNDTHHLVRMLDHFLFQRHICIVFELLGMNLYDVLRANKNKGMGISFTKTTSYQLLQSLHSLKRGNIIHCDLKPENILLTDSTVKLIDFGSACFENSTLYTYIQSRHYRAPEVILGLPYSCSIDMWSFGCVIAELLLGIPIFPGESEYNQLAKIMELVGQPSKEILDKGSKTSRFFKKIPTTNGSYEYVFMTSEEYSFENNVPIVENKRYHRFTTINEFCSSINLHRNNKISTEDDKVRMILTNFFQRIFTIDPTIRLTPEQAASHPFLHSKYNKHDFIDDVVTITKNYSMDDVVRSIYQHHLSLSYLQSQNFTVQKYYQTYIKALHAGFVLNVLHVNPFRRTPFKCGIHPYVPMQEDSSIASEDELPPITPPTRIPPRCRSRSLNLGVMEECELPPIDFVVPNTTRQMVTTPTKNQLHSLRPPPQCPRSGLALSPRQVSHRVLTVF